MQRPASTPLQRRLNARFVQRAIATNAPLLAPLLQRHCEYEALTWEQLAQALDAPTLDDLHQIALCRPPRPEHFARDVESIAEGHAAPERLLSLLRQIQVLEHWADRAAESRAAYESPAMLLAARDREEEENLTQRRRDAEREGEAHTETQRHGEEIKGQEERDKGKEDPIQNPKSKIQNPDAEAEP